MQSPQELEAALFRTAVGLRAGAERGAFLNQACAGDAALRARVEMLLAEGEPPNATATPTKPEAAGRSDSLLESPAVHDGHTESCPPDTDPEAALKGERMM
jgi:hypothetical protein